MSSLALRSPPASKAGGSAVLQLAILHLAAFGVRALPARAAAAFGGALGWFCGAVLRIRRGSVEEAMQRAGVDAPRVAAATMYRQLGRGLVELLRLAAAPSVTRRAMAAGMAALDPEAAAALDAAVRSGPVVLLASHTGNWELAASVAATALARRGRRLAIVVKPQSARGIDRFITDLRASLGLTLVSPARALTRAQALLAQGDVVAMPIDQVPDRPSHADVVPFLGANALVDRAPAMLALRARATVLVVAAAEPRVARDDSPQTTPRDGSQGPRTRVRVLGVIAPYAGGGRRAWVEATTARATALLEAHIARHPASWLWLHRRWKGAPCKDAEPTLIPPS